MSHISCVRLLEQIEEPKQPKEGVLNIQYFSQCLISCSTVKSMGEFMAHHFHELNVRQYSPE